MERCRECRSASLFISPACLWLVDGLGLLSNMITMGWEVGEKHCWECIENWFGRAMIGIK